MFRFKLLLTLVIIGLYIIYHFLPLGNYCVGIINGIILLVLIPVYLIVWLYEFYLNIDESKYLKKPFDKSSLYITIILIVLFELSQTLDINLSKKVLTADINLDKFWGSYELELRKNKKYKLTHHMDETCYFFGDYIINNDTLILKDYYDLDIVFFIDSHKRELIPLSDNKELFVTDKPFIISSPISEIE